MGWLRVQEALEKEEEIAPSTEEDGSEELGKDISLITILQMSIINRNSREKPYFKSKNRLHS